MGSNVASTSSAPDRVTDQSTRLPPPPPIDRSGERASVPTGNRTSAPVYPARNPIPDRDDYQRTDSDPADHPPSFVRQNNPRTNERFSSPAAWENDRARFHREPGHREPNDDPTVLPLEGTEAGPHEKGNHRNNPIQGEHSYAVQEDEEKPVSATTKAPWSKNYDESKHCSYHDRKGHSTEECWDLQRQLAAKFAAGELKGVDLKKPQPYQKRGQRDSSPKRDRSPEKETDSPPPAPKKRVDMVLGRA
ncbi:hypothetical protein F2Q70_00025427 [Brassica cretica]|uniref:Retrotransposon gag domain-containing protein n=1 Tax=Brassica cretica TaxID=69181 RepID=A0A8S9LGV1_BRACR|nr:hypothetical protein F2Q70_00025427 [Brassica cretica]